MTWDLILHIAFNSESKVEVLGGTEANKSGAYSEHFKR